jgi:nucleoside-diphosphate-sugar epimerase
VNIHGTEKLCHVSLIEGVERFIYVSTSDVFGFRDKSLIDESVEYQYWNEPYPDTKIEASRIVWKYFREGLPATIVYPCWVYGNGDRTLIPLLADAIRKKGLLFWRKGTIIWPAYIKNVIDLFIVVSKHPDAVGEGFIVHDGVSVTFEDFATNIAEEMGFPNVSINIPYHMAYFSAWSMELIWKLLRLRLRPILTTYIVKNLGSRSQYTIEKALKLLDWSPSVSYGKAFTETMVWLKSQSHQNLKIK